MKKVMAVEARITLTEEEFRDEATVERKIQEMVNQLRAHILHEAKLMAWKREENRG